MQSIIGIVILKLDIKHLYKMYKPLVYNVLRSSIWSLTLSPCEVSIKSKKTKLQVPLVSLPPVVLTIACSNIQNTFAKTKYIGSNIMYE